MVSDLQNKDRHPPPADFGSRAFPTALVNVTNACNLSCKHCFVFRKDNPNQPSDKMDDATMLRQLRLLRDKHKIESMLFMGGELKETIIGAQPKAQILEKQ